MFAQLGRSVYNLSQRLFKHILLSIALGVLVILFSSFFREHLFWNCLNAYYFGLYLDSGIP